MLGIVSLRDPFRILLEGSCSDVRAGPQAATLPRPSTLYYNADTPTCSKLTLRYALLVQTPACSYVAVLKTIPLRRRLWAFVRSGRLHLHEHHECCCVDCARCNNIDWSVGCWNTHDPREHDHEGCDDTKPGLTVSEILEQPQRRQEHDRLAYDDASVGQLLEFLIAGILRYCFLDMFSRNMFRSKQAIRCMC
ncbi:uncharacterized protein M421DRAFT_259588 [Didymella exigua CBS 183.55]|uniref:Uncharacterized protein n=1 Tax=Didymella exigua CBS 183.55 TaxID=1150837 RepID=A0A6A5RD69_9PLEO|nr:uncharacterized protein M421DRAFT_259588 [Didymella exigua CBS 183.55]KAF1925339.1 hypothetical protein M421DRAFT_259588 [Didymella exigua CBS 183.55]